MTDTRARGLDLSSNQDPARMRYGDWRINPGLSFGWYRASIGSITDRHQAAHGAGLRGTDYLTGCYHALHEAVPPAAQAQLFLSLQHAGNRLPPALDVERAALTRQHVLDFLRAWARLGGPRLTLYSSRQSWLGIMGAEPLPDDVRGLFALLWIAAYPYDSADPQPMDAASVALRSTPPLARTPPIPAPWANWEVWQHSGHGSLPGYDGFIDLNVYNGTEAELRARLRVTTMPTGKTKLGLHHGTGGRDARQWATVATVMKYVGDLGASNDAPADCLLVGRVVDDGAFAGQGFDANRMEQTIAPKDAAAQYVAFLADKIRLNPRIDVWEGPNEQVITAQDVMAWYGAFSHEFARLVQGLGKRAGLGAWAVGTPAFDLWPFWTLALQATVDFGAVLTRHEYGPPNGFLGLRYRVDQREFTQLGYPAVPLIISECGGDNVPGSGPWRLYYRTIDRYWNELLRPYALELERDAYVLGATVFTDGGGWPDFDVSGSGLVDKVLAFAGGLVVDPPPPPPPPPTGDDELSPSQRERIEAELVKAETAHAAIRNILAETPAPPPWWELWPAGVITPTRKLRATGRTITIYAVDGLTVITTRVQSGEWDVSERRGALLRVLDQAEPRPDWYVRAADVEPK